jgi:glycerol uptake facilitator-like aquaporin
VLSLSRRMLAEFLGTGLLVAAVVGSGIAASRLSPGDVGLELLENALATGFALAVIILVFAPVSGAHLNPVVSLVDHLLSGLTTRELGAYAIAQVAGGAAGAVVANLIFSAPAFEVSTKTRTGDGLWLGEVVATMGLVLLVFALARTGRGHATAAAVGAYIAGAYFFTSSTSFANPAVTIGRMFSDSFAGIAPRSSPAFVMAQLLGAGMALGLVRVLYPEGAVASRPKELSL